MKAYLKFELQSFFFDRKNQVIYLMLLVLGCYYSLVLAPQYTPIEQVDPSEIEARFEDRQTFLQQVTIDENTHYMVRYAAMIFPQWNQLDQQRLTALAAHDLPAYAQATADWYHYADDIYYHQAIEGFTYNPQYFTLAHEFPFQDAHFAYQREASKYQALANVKNLSLAAFEEKTALQTVYRLSLVSLPMIIFAALAFLTGDIWLKDRKHASVLQGFPLSIPQQLSVKLIVMYGALLAVILIFLPAFLLLANQFGLGDFAYPVVLYQGNHLNNGTFTTISLGHYFLLYGGILLLWGLCIFTLQFVLSFLFKKEWLNIVIIFLLLGLEWLYFRRGSGNYHHYDWFLTSYLKIGQVLTGSANFLYGSLKFTVQKMLLLLSSASFLTTSLLYLLARSQRRRL